MVCGLLENVGISGFVGHGSMVRIDGLAVRNGVQQSTLHHSLRRVGRKFNGEEARVRQWEYAVRIGSIQLLNLHVVGEALIGRWQTCPTPHKSQVAAPFLRVKRFEHVPKVLDLTTVHRIVLVDGVLLQYGQIHGR